jgi:hypothetical protein
VLMTLCFSARSVHSIIGATQKRWVKLIIRFGPRAAHGGLLKVALRRRQAGAHCDAAKRPTEGIFVPLREVATIRGTSARYGVLHEGGQRIQIVTASTADQDVGTFSAGGGSGA